MATEGDLGGQSNTVSSIKDIKKQYRSMLKPSTEQPKQTTAKPNKKKQQSASSNASPSKQQHSGSSSTRSKTVKSQPPSKNSGSLGDKPKQATKNAPKSATTPTSSSRSSSPPAPGPRGFGKTPGHPPALTTGTPSTAKGFGSAAAAVAAAESAADTSKLRLFVFAVETKRVQAAINANQWQDKVVIVPTLAQASAMVACKLTAGGKHQNLIQVSRGPKPWGFECVSVAMWS
jgi:hypothetical protein